MHLLVVMFRLYVCSFHVTIDSDDDGDGVEGTQSYDRGGDNSNVKFSTTAYPEIRHISVCIQVQNASQTKSWID